MTDDGAAVPWWTEAVTLLSTGSIDNSQQQITDKVRVCAGQSLD